MLVPHGSDALRTWSVSERTVRNALWGAALLGVLLVAGAGTIARQLWRLGSRPAMAATAPSVAEPADDVGTLRSSVADLNEALDTIRSADAKLRAVAGSASPMGDSVAKLLQAQTDSLLRSASVVARSYGSLADSAARAHRGRGRSGARSGGGASR